MCVSRIVSHTQVLHHTEFCSCFHIDGLVPNTKNPVFHAWNIEVHYHFVSERVLSGEVELHYVQMDRQNANIFTKPLRLNKLRQFSGALGLRHLDVPNLMGRDVPNDHV